MKKFTFLTMAMLLITSMSFGQLIPYVKTVGHTVNSAKVLPYKPDNFTDGKVIIDTAGWTSNYIPEFGAGASPMTLYTIGMIDQDDNHIGYWFGTSGDFDPDSTETDYWAQCWLTNGTVKVAGILFFAAGKYEMVGGASSTVQMGVQNMEAAGCITGGTPGAWVTGFAPTGTYLASGTMNIADVDTTFGMLNYIEMATPPTVAGDFCAVANFKNMRINGDTCWMFSDAEGDGALMNYSQYCSNPAIYYWVSCAFSTLDRNIGMFAVIDDGAGMTDEYYFNGFKMSIRQNPVRDNAIIDYAIENSSKVKCTIWDIKGNEVAVVEEGNKTAGQYSINIDISNLTSGLYFCALSSSNGGKMIKKLVIE